MNGFFLGFESFFEITLERKAHQSLNNSSRGFTSFDAMVPGRVLSYELLISVLLPA
jgi:hypothetical protein